MRFCGQLACAVYYGCMQEARAGMPIFQEDDVQPDVCECIFVRLRFSRTFRAIAIDLGCLLPF